MANSSVQFEFSIFQFLKDVLDNIQTRIPRLEDNNLEQVQPSDRDSDDDYAKFLRLRKKDIIDVTVYEMLTDYYFRDTERLPINFDDPAIQYAYVRKYVCSRADIITQKIVKSKRLGKLFQASTTINVTSIGAGPGTDILGIIKYCKHKQKDNSFTLNCTLLDSDASWITTWGTIQNKLNDDTNVPFVVHSEYLTVNLTAHESLKPHEEKIRETNLFTFSYVLSEMANSDTGLQFLRKLVKTAMTGSLFLFVDNNGMPRVTDCITKLLSTTSLQLPALGRQEKWYYVSRNEEAEIKNKRNPHYYDSCSEGHIQQTSNCHVVLVYKSEEKNVPIKHDDTSGKTLQPGTGASTVQPGTSASTVQPGTCASTVKPGPSVSAVDGCTSLLQTTSIVEEDHDLTEGLSEL